MSDVEAYWEAIRAKWGGPTKPYKELSLQQQYEIIHSINLLLSVLHAK